MPVSQSQGAADFRAGPAADGPVLFWAERDLQLAIGGWALFTAITFPVALFLPLEMVLGAAASLALTWANVACFRFELTASELAVRTSFFGRTRRWPLDEIRAVEVRDTAMEPVPWGRVVPVGHLVVRVADEELAIPGLREPVEAARAIVAVQAGEVGPPA